MSKGSERPFCIVLAGGQARRMGGIEKPLLTLAGHGRVFDCILKRVGPQCSGLAINTGSRDPRWGSYSLPRIPDSETTSVGPLAGVLASIDWLAAHSPDVRWLLTVPGDTPFLPRDLVSRLTAALDDADAEIACAASGGRIHPVVALWSCEVREELRRALAGGEYRVRAFQSRFTIATVEWDSEPVDPFFNINTPDHLRAAEALARITPPFTPSES